MYSCSSLTGFVSSKRRLQWPPNSAATPKLSEMDFAWLLHDEADYAGAATAFRALGARLAAEGKAQTALWAA